MKGFERTLGGAPADQTNVRRANLGLVLRHVAEHGPCSRAAVAGETGLTRGTVSSLVGELVELGLVRETGSPLGPRGVGRPGVALDLAGAIGALGLEINVEHLAARIEDVRGGERFERRVTQHNRGSDPGESLDALAALAMEALDAAHEQGITIVGAAVALPGLVRLSSGTLLIAPNLGWTDVAVAAELRQRLGRPMPVHVDNEANLAAVAEHRAGVARDLQSFISVFGEVGVGGGAFVNGELFRGEHGFAGEIGHVTVDPAGAPCACGSNGCLETVAGLEAIARRAGLSNGEPVRAWEVTGEVARRAAAGDGAALAALDEAGHALGLALASAINLFDPEAVVLGGTLGSLAPWLAPAVERALAVHVMATRSTVCEVRGSVFGDAAPVRGAAAMVLRSVLADPLVARVGELSAVG